MASGASILETFNIIHPEDYAKHGYPHEVWTWLRHNDPVHRWERTEGLPFWAITKHADIVEISKQPERFLSAPRITVSHMPEERMDEFPGGCDRFDSRRSSR